MPTNTQPDTSVYISYQKTDPDSIFQITCSDSQASRNEQVSGFPTYKTTPMLAAMMLYQKPDLYHRIDKSSWEIVARGFDDLHTKGMFNEQSAAHNPTPVVEATPLDLPVNAALARFRLVQDFQSPANIPRQKELTEILMADIEGRPVNPDLFSEESRQQPTWSDTVGSTPQGELLERHRYLSKLYKDVKRSYEHILASGDTLPPAMALQARQLLVDMMEMDALNKQQECRLSDEEALQRSQRIQKEEGEGLFGAYPIYRDNGIEGREVYSIVLRWTDALDIQSEGISIGAKTPVTDLINEIKPHRLTDKMSDLDWSIVAAAMRDVGQEDRRQNPDRSPLFPINSPDLPEELVSSRLDALIEHFQAEHDLGAYVELCELERANHQGQPADGRLFTTASWDNIWTITQGDIPADVLEQSIDQMVREGLAMTDPRELARQQQMVSEAEYTLNALTEESTASMSNG